MSEARSPLDAPKIRLPQAEVLAMFGGAAAMMFAILFTISAAVMAPPRDVRLADEPVTRTRVAPAPSAVENAALVRSSTLR